MNDNNVERGHQIYWLFVIPFIAVLFAPLFNYKEPSLGGIPFFYWYQLAWIPVSVFITYFIYRREG
jgi:hypothetical protein